MFLTAEQMGAAQRASMETLCGLTQKVCESLTRLTMLHIEASTANLATGADAAMKTVTANTADELHAIRMDALRQVHDKFFHYIDQLCEIAGSVHFDLESISATVDKNGAEMIHHFFAKVAESTPAASEDTMAIVRAAIQAANKAYGAVHIASRQTAAIANIPLKEEPCT